MFVGRARGPERSAPLGVGPAPRRGRYHQTVRPRVLAVLGPTASGKSALGLSLAEQLAGEIINCDSTTHGLFLVGAPMSSFPDGKCVAHQSNESGSQRNLRARCARFAQRIERKGEQPLRASQPRMLFAAHYGNGYDVSPGASRFLMVKENVVRQEQSDELHVVVNWSEGLRRLVPLPK